MVAAVVTAGLTVTLMLPLGTTKTAAPVTHLTHAADPTLCSASPTRHQAVRRSSSSQKPSPRRGPAEGSAVANQPNLDTAQPNWAGIRTGDYAIRGDNTADEVIVENGHPVGHGIAHGTTTTLRSCTWSSPER